MKPPKILGAGRLSGFVQSVELVPVLFLALVWQSQAATNFVTSLADGGSGSLRQVIADSAPGDTIVFNPTGVITLSGGELALANNLTIQGPGSSLLTISGNQASRIFNVQTGATVVISDVNISNGLTPNGTNGFNNGLTSGPAGPGLPGGAILNAGSLSLKNCLVLGNATGNGGNGANGNSGSAGASGGSGGAIYNTGDLSVSNCLIQGNTTGSGGSGGNGSKGSGGDGGSGGSGGGIYSVNQLTSSVIILTDCTISGNSTGGGGHGGSPGPVGGSGGQGGSGGSGGGIYSGNQLTLAGCAIFGNSCGGGGDGFTMGGFIPGGGQGGSGGGIYNLGQLSATNCTIANNYPGIGGSGVIGSNGSDGNAGGIFAGGYNQFLIACTIATNRAGGVTGSASLLNTIVALNSGANPDVNGQFNSMGHNLIGATNGAGGFGAPGDLLGVTNSPLNPQISPLANNGGPTLTIALAWNSPAIDAGAAVGGPAVDQRGVARPQGRGVDIGAYEFQFPQIVGAQFQSATCFGLCVCGPPNQSFAMQVSTNLLWWSDFGSYAENSNGVCEVSDSQTSGSRARFYRLTPAGP